MIRFVSKLVVMAVFSILLFTACFRSHPGETDSPGDAIVVEDFRGETLSFSQPPRRIVCLIESALSGLYMLGADSLIAGVPQSVYKADLYPWYARLDVRISKREMPAPGNWDFVSLESLAAIKPELVIIWAEQTDAIENIERLGIPVYAVMLHSFEDVHKEIRDLGTITGREERARELLAFTEAQKKTFRRQISGEDRQRAYFMWSQGVLETSGSRSTVEELFQLAGLENVVKNEDEHLVINKETLLSLDPDLIIMWYNEKLDPADVMTEPGFSQMKAIRSKRVYELPSVFACDFWTLKYLNAARMVAQWAYPEAYSQNDSLLSESHLMDSLYQFHLKR